MKKIFAIVAVAAASLVLASQAHAQFGVIAGLTSSKTNAVDAAKDVKNIALYHAGLTYKFNLGAGFAIQPSIIYQVKGAKIENVGNTTPEQLKTGFVEVPLSIQWGPDLLAFRPYAFAEPFVGYKISSFVYGDGDVFTEQLKNEMKKIEYGFGLGGGLEIASHVQLSVQWFKNLGKFSDGGNVAEKVKNSNFQGIKVSLAVLF
jgi:hypothetical protein